MLPDPFREMGARRHSAETQHLDHDTSKSETEVKIGRSNFKDGAPERLKCRTIQKVVS